MLVCPDCRNGLQTIGDICSACSWRPVIKAEVANYLSTKDRGSADVASYIETYEMLAERNMLVPVQSNRYVEHLSRRFVDILGNVEGKDFCDVGSGRGFFIKHVLEKRPHSVTAVDIAASSLGRVARTYPVSAFLANAENLPFERHFDVITATDILEHVLNVANFLITANWALRDGGILAVRVPYRENLLYYSNFHGLPMHFTHLRTFDRALLVDIVESAGFEVRSVHHDGFSPNYPQPFWDRFAWFRRRILDAIKARFPMDDDVTTINPRIGRLFMKPIEIAVLATKTHHLTPVNAHESLGKFYRDRKESLLQGNPQNER